MKQFCVFVGMFIIHDHTKCHTTSWIYSVLIILTTNEQNYIQNSHEQCFTYYIHKYIHIHIFSGATLPPQIFTQSFVGKRSKQFKAENQLLKSSIVYDVTHTHTHLTPTIGHTHYESINLPFFLKNMN
jgi:hypothetical protein